MITLGDIHAKCHAEKAARLRDGGLLARSYFVHRRISTVITWVVLNMLPGVTPNQISLIMLLTGIVGTILLAMPDPFSSALGLLLLYFSLLLDKVDGDVARFREQYSDFGKIIDEWYHATPQPLMLLAFGIHIYAFSHSPLVLVLAITCHAGALITRLTPKLMDGIQKGDDTPKEAAAETGTAPEEKSSTRRAFVAGLDFLQRFDVCIAVLATAVAAEILLEQNPSHLINVSILALYTTLWSIRLPFTYRAVRNVLA